MNFVSLMNSRRFQPTEAQMRQLTEATKSIIGVENVSLFALSNVNHNIGKAEFIKAGRHYQAARLNANSRWYLTGDYVY